MTLFPPDQPDADARHRIAHDLDETLFVEAGAGSGKTHALVGRIVALVATGTATLSELAAITFTEKAAAELRDRVRRSLAELRTAAWADGDDVAVARCSAALDELDSAAIGTLHGFAQRILVEHPIEAGLPPRVDVLDEVASAVAFEDRWSSFVDELLADPAVERPLLLATAAGARLTALRAIAVAFGENWDLALDQAPSSAVDPEPWDDRLTALLDEFDAVCADDDHCTDGSDRLALLLGDLRAWCERIRAAGDEYTRLALLGTDGGRPGVRASRRGAKGNWPPGHDLDGLRTRVDDIGDRCEALRNEVALAAVERLAVELRRFTLDAAAERRDEGRLEFHDLLVLARQLLRDPRHGPAVRRALHDRYRRLLIDEFQDTDPIQVELAVLIATPPPEPVAPESLPSEADGDVPVGRPVLRLVPDVPDAAPTAWDEVEPDPGRLFFVGDPKQSIYRFRRADISLFLRAAERFGRGGRKLALTTNFRSGRGIIDAVNKAFGHLIQPSERGGQPSQPAYEPFVPVREDAPGGPAVSVLGRVEHTDRPRAAEVRTRESTEVAAAVRRALDEGWLVTATGAPTHSVPAGAEPSHHDETGHGAGARDGDDGRSGATWRPCRARDITILVPTRTVLPALEDALGAVGVAYRAESASLVYASRLVRDLLLTLRAVDDPTDELSVVAALRSPLFACGDDDLVTYRQLGGRFDPARRGPDEVPPDHPVARALGYLDELHEARLWHPPSELIDRIVRDRRVLELGEAEGRPRDLWRRVRFVADQARAWSEATDGTLRQYLGWIGQQTAEGARVAEAVLPETDDDAVRIMTIHAAKGLQFPITIVTGLSTQPRRWFAEAEVAWPPGRPCLITIGRKVTSEAFEAWKPIDEQMSHDERIRLLYVACTRAQDHLVVSLHRARRRTPVDDPSRWTNAELLAGAFDATSLLDALPDAAPAPPGPSPEAAPVAPGPPRPHLTLAPPPPPDAPDEPSIAARQERDGADAAARPGSQAHAFPSVPAVPAGSGPSRGETPGDSGEPSAREPQDPANPPASEVPTHRPAQARRRPPHIPEQMAFLFDAPPLPSATAADGSLDDAATHVHETIAVGPRDDDPEPASDADDVATGPGGAAAPPARRHLWAVPDRPTASAVPEPVDSRGPADATEADGPDQPATPVPRRAGSDDAFRDPHGAPGDHDAASGRKPGGSSDAGDQQGERDGEGPAHSPVAGEPAANARRPAVRYSDLWRGTGDADAPSRPDGEAGGQGGDGGDRTGTTGDGLPPFEEWRREREEALAAAGRPRTIAATALTEDGRPDAADDPGLRKRPRDLDLPPWQKGRYGTAVGRAVHGVLQTIDLATGDGVGSAVAAQAAAEGVTGLEDRIRTLVEAALRSPSVQEAAVGAHWRELYVGVPLAGGRLLEGYVDLLYRRPGAGLVVVDYKTGPADTEVDLAPLVERYRRQGASYALAVEEATGEAVVDVVFAFLTPEGPVERSLPDLAGAVADVRRLAESGDPSLVALG